MSRYIDADALIKNHPKICSMNMKYNLDLAPTLDLVERPVTCGECIYRDTANCPVADKLQNNITTGYFSPVFMKYCGVGKRKEQK